MSFSWHFSYADDSFVFSCPVISWLIWASSLLTVSLCAPVRQGRVSLHTCGVWRCQYAWGVLERRGGRGGDGEKSEWGLAVGVMGMSGSKIWDEAGPRGVRGPGDLRLHSANKHRRHLRAAVWGREGGWCCCCCCRGQGGGGGGAGWWCWVVVKGESGGKRGGRWTSRVNTISPLFS